MKRLAAVVAVLVAALLVYGVAVEPRFILDERRYTVALPGLPEQWDGAEVAVFSDIQAGMWWANTGMVERVVDRVVDEQPDAVLIAGDFLYSTSPSVEEQVAHVLDLLAPLTGSGVPTAVVLGNHDYAVGGAQELTAVLEAAGIPVLENEAIALDPPGSDGGGALHVVGLAATQPGLTDVSAALDGLPEDAARIVVMHDPTVFPRLPAGSAPLAVAGHTHCGQVALPGKPRWSYLGLTAEERVVADGWAPEEYGERGNAMFVTCGIGFSVVPVRINAPPQLVFFDLVAG